MQRNRSRSKSSSINATIYTIECKIEIPTELLNGRTIRTTLPVKVNPTNDQEEIRQLLSTQQENQVGWYDRNSKPMPMFFQDQPIQIQDPIKKTCSPAKVVKVGQTPRSYVAEKESGVQFRRNRNYIKPDVQEKAQLTSQKGESESHQDNHETKCPRNCPINKSTQER